MGMFANVMLLEPMNCFRCGSTPNDNVGSNLRERVVKLGQDKLRLFILHDGKGGIKGFQTKDIEPEAYLDRLSYRFPGYIPNEAYGGGGISLTEVCNECETMWIGELYVKPHEADHIHITKSLDIWPQDEGGVDDLSFKLALWQSNSNLYTFSNPAERVIRIVPDVEQVVRLYQQKSLEAILKSQNAIDVLRSISHANVPANEILRYLDENLQYVEQKRVSYENELARAVVDYDVEKEKARYSQSALTAALIILSNYDSRNALVLRDVSGLDPEDFETYLDTSRWFFVPPEQMTEHDLLASFFGVLGGPNMFLLHLKEHKS